MKFPITAFLCLASQIALYAAMVIDKRLDVMRSVGPRILINKARKDFDKLRSVPSDSRINVKARMSFDKAKRVSKMLESAYDAAKDVNEEKEVMPHKLRNNADENGKMDAHLSVTKSKATKQARKLRGNALSQKKPGRIHEVLKFERKLPRISSGPSVSPLMTRETDQFGSKNNLQDNIMPNRTEPSLTESIDSSASGDRQTPAEKLQNSAHGSSQNIHAGKNDHTKERRDAQNSESQYNTYK